MPRTRKETDQDNALAIPLREPETTETLPTRRVDSDDQPTLHGLLELCAVSLTEKAAHGELPAAYGREQEIEHIMTSLASPLKGRIVVTGGPRVGKTAVIQEIAARIQAGKCPDGLKGSEMWALSPRSILRAFGVQDWQEKLGRLLENWVERSNVILYVDALPTTVLAGATVEDPFDMAQFLLGQLQSSNNRILAEGRTQAVNNFLETYPEYRHILMEVRIAEPEDEAALEIVKRATADLEIAQDISIDQEAVDVALDLTRRFALAECLPGKAIDLIGEGIALRTEKRKADEQREVTGAAIVARFGEKTGLPRMLLTDDEPYDEGSVHHYFSDRVLGQDQAVDLIIQSLSLLRTRLNNPRRPMGVFLFIGPTGVGKTELARTLASFLFSSEDRIVRFNMADYNLEWHMHTLFGDPHGFSPETRRGQFTLRVQDHAFAVVLLDEFEKAHPSVFQRFLQLFDEGVLINGASESVNLRNMIFILTSNFGTRVLSSGRLGFGPRVSPEDQEERLREEMVSFFTPEFINRIDGVSFFKSLTKPVLREIAYRRIQEVLHREGLTRRNLDVEVDEDVVEWVVEHGYSERYGARYLARQIEKTITYPLARQVIRHGPPPGSLLRLFVRNDRVASALLLPADHTGEETAPARSVAAARVPPGRLTLPYMRGSLPLLRERVEALEAAHDVAVARQRMGDMMQAMSTPSFWDDLGAVQPKLDALGRLSGQVELVDGLRRNLNELTEFLAQIEEEGATTLLGEAALRCRYLVRELPRVELTLLFSDPWDTYGAYLHIEARGQRQAAYEWAVELGRMYLKWAERREFLSVIISEDLTREGVPRAIWFGIDGYGAYGLLRGETGTHRLVQGLKDGGKSNGKRQVVQAAVSVWPDLPEAQLPAYDQRRLQTTVHKVDRPAPLSRRLRHRIEAQLAEGGVPLCLTSSLPNEELMRETINLLRLSLALGDRPLAAAADPVWGSVARSYVRYKQHYVQDPRTGLKTGKIKAVLNGEIDPFLEAYLRHVAIEAESVGDST